jgi:hypothetical protein
VQRFLDVLIEFVLHPLRDLEQLGINPLADRFQALGRFLVQPVEFGFQLRSGKGQESR